MVTTYKKLRAREWTWSGNGFTRQTPSEKQTTAPKPSLVYKRARYYHPQLGQFISRDPLGYVDGMSLYRGYFVPGAVDPYGMELLFTYHQKQYAKAHCKCACKGLAIRALFDWFGLLEQHLRDKLMTDTIKETGTLNIDRSSIQETYGVSDWWINNNFQANGDLIPDREAHSAIRHCVASAKLVNLFGCKCAKCLGDAREIPDDWLGQPRRSTQAQLYNNFVGRQVATCGDELADRDLYKDKKDINDLAEVVRIDNDDIFDSCVSRFKRGKLDPSGGITPFGQGTKLIDIPDKPNIIRDENGKVVGGTFHDEMTEVFYRNLPPSFRKKIRR